MSHFYGTVAGNRGPAHRGGSKHSGLRAHANGWGFGVSVYVWHDKETGKDYAKVYQTNGSAAGSSETHVLTLREGGAPEIIGAPDFRTFVESFLKEFESAEDVNAANRRLVREARRLLGIKAAKAKA